MPCMYYTPEEELAIAHRANKQLVLELTTEINFLTALLCETTTTLDKLVANGCINGYSMTPELELWKVKHEELDKKSGRR